ncbi:MAG: LLM class flavin-dependent oxidoreductase [Actinomycetota bacterium]
MATIALRFDLRSPEWAATPHRELYPACLEMSAWADENGIDIIAISEHHGLPDGFMCSPFTVAAAIAGCTKRIPITVAAALVPMHDPIRLAEQIATVDLLSKGRVSFVAGAGYARHEFEMAGIDRSKRGAILEESIEVMRKAWTGEEFEYRGRKVRVTPKPFSNPAVFMGGSSDAAARRAARLKLWFFPAIGEDHLIETYEQECAKAGYQGFVLKPHGPGFVHVTEDPDKAWEEISRYAWYDAETYRAMQTAGTRSSVTTKASTPQELRTEGIYRVVTPDECVALAEELGPLGTITLHPLMSGMPVELGWSSLELFKEQVLPRIR